MREALYRREFLCETRENCAENSPWREPFPVRRTDSAMTSVMTIDSGMFRNPNRDLVVNIKGTKKPLEDDYSYPKRDWFWTGKRPVHAECPGVAEDGHMTSLPLPNCSEVRSPSQSSACSWHGVLCSARACDCECHM